MAVTASTAACSASSSAKLKLFPFKFLVRRKNSAVSPAAAPAKEMTPISVLSEALESSVYASRRLEAVCASSSPCSRPGAASIVVVDRGRPRAAGRVGLFGGGGVFVGYGWVGWAGLHRWVGLWVCMHVRGLQARAGREEGGGAGEEEEARGQGEQQAGHFAELVVAAVFVLVVVMVAVCLLCGQSGQGCGMWRGLFVPRSISRRRHRHRLHKAGGRPNSTKIDRGRD